MLVAAGDGAADRHRRRALAPLAGKLQRRRKTCDPSPDSRPAQAVRRDPACDGVNFVVNKGEFLSLVGSNGAGKTSLVNLISAQLTPDSRQDPVRGQATSPIATVNERIKAGIARSFQIVNLFDGLSVFDNVALSIFSREGKTVHIGGARRARSGGARAKPSRARPVRPAR